MRLGLLRTGDRSGTGIASEVVRVSNDGRSNHPSDLNRRGEFRSGEDCCDDDDAGTNMGGSSGGDTAIGGDAVGSFCGEVGVNVSLHGRPTTLRRCKFGDLPPNC